MSVRRILHQNPTDSEKRLLGGVLVFLAGTYLLALAAVNIDNVVLGSLRVVVGFAFITLVPGYLLRRLFRIQASSVLQSLLDSVGLSILYCVVVAALLDVVLSRIAEPPPGSAFSVVLVLSISAMVVIVIRRGEWKPPSLSPSVRSDRRFRPAVALLTALPLVSVLGTHFVNQSNSNHVALLFVFLAATLPILLRTRVIPRSLRPYAVFCVALAVLYHTSLISPHIWGWDTHYEYNISLRLLERHWDPTVSNSLVPLLTVTFLSGLYTTVTGLPLVSVLKVVYPVIFALMPVGVYVVSAHVFEDRGLAVIAPFFTIFYYGFFKVIPGKQAFAEVFFVLFLVAAVRSHLTESKRAVLAICFLSALVFSHYAASLLFCLFLGAAYAGALALTRTSRFTAPESYTIVRPLFVVSLGLIWLLWFNFTGGGVVVERVISTAQSTVHGLFSQTSDRSGIAYATRSSESLLWVLHKAIYVVVIGLGGLGVLRELVSLYHRQTIDVRGEYALIGAVMCAFIASAAVVTYNMGFDRALHIGLVVLAPFVVLGARWPVALLAERTSYSSLFSARNATTALSVFLAVMFVFSSGAVFAVAGQDVPEYSVGLNKNAGFPVYTENEVAATQWADDQLPVCAGIGVYSDRSRANSRDGLLLGEVIPQPRIELISPNQTTIQNSTYMYVSDRPLDYRNELGRYIEPNSTEYHDHILTHAEVVYARDNVRIYRVRERPECSRENGRLTPAPSGKTLYVTSESERVSPRARPSSRPRPVAITGRLERTSSTQ
ncbi:DUF2206 domain-containing protein [Halogeometricum luteum]|uniref:DUF2206 domain-containing protein n=1 Tax=Halogeometricum luteum TaxID=2950537 RepID=A0ABU2G573_9EURY|nr:DUF2206 domain-containing protein [Halogeometricum sp. S3BR5-2]MDS0295298.1 DUF2206 domain-containing protein [Halogeometricum sp. S3BR5-2]